MLLIIKRICEYTKNLKKIDTLYLITDFNRRKLSVFTALLHKEDRRRQKIILLGGHAYSWGINTHLEMLLLENTRS